MEATRIHPSEDEVNENGWFSRIKKRFRHLDLWLLIPIIAIMIFGVAMVYTASTNMATGSAFSYLKKQAFFAVLSVVVMLIIYVLRINWQSKYVTRAIAGLNIFFLFLMLYALVAGPVVSGAKGWIYIGSFGIQPIEGFKISMILYLAHRFTRKQPKPKAWFPKIKWWDFIIPVLGMICAFLMPDFGGLVILLLILLIMLTMSGIRPAALLILVGLVIGVYVAIPFSIPVLEKLPFLQYQLARFEAYINPWSAGDAGHQLINSYYAISNGGMFGRGLGNSIQKTGYLPEPNTDFIMAVVGEELGAITILLVLLVFTVIIWRLIVMGLRARYIEQRLVLYGIATYVLVQILINLGGAVGILPITGVTFPMISYGGSSLLSWGLTFGIALSIIGKIKAETSGNRIERKH